MGVVLANKRILSAILAVDVQIFWPLTKYPSLIFFANVFNLPVSKPASGSVTPKHVFCLPVIRGGNQVSFCSLFPCTTIGCGPKIFICIEDAAAIPPPVSEIFCIKIEASLTPRLVPPNSFGMQIPNHPPSAISL